MRVAEVDFPNAALVYLTIGQGESAILEAIAAEAGCDPVAHLYREDGVGWVQVAFNDNYGRSLSSRISYTNSSENEEFLFFVRSKTYYSGGLTTVSITVGQDVYDDYDVLVQSTALSSALFTQGFGEELRTAELPGGSLFPAVFPVASDPWPGETDVYSWGLSPALSGGAAGTVVGPAEDVGGYVFVTPQVLEDTDQDLSFESVNAREGDGHVYINDSSDSDGDGVGDELEAVLGTCSGVGTCQYSGTVVTQDTDHDGLTDGEELFGLVGSDTYGRDDVSFPRWGANPLHKDLFVQFNYFKADDLTPNPFGTLANLDTWADDFVAYYGAGSTSELRNPDGEPGIAAHLDVGVTPSVPEREEYYGDYPTLAVRGEPSFYAWRFLQPISDWDGDLLLMVSRSPSQYGQWGFHSDDVVGSSPSDFASHLHSVMELEIPSSWDTVETLSGGELSMETEDPDEADELIVWLACRPDGSQTWSFCSSLGLAEDLDNINGARRNHLFNAYYMDFVRLGRFFYASVVLGGGGQAGGTPARTFVAGMSDPATPAHELGHCVGIHDGGNGAPGYEDRFSICAPNYSSIMSYVRSNAFHQSTDAFAMNPASVSDQTTLPADSCSLADRMSTSPWYYYTEEIGGTPPTECYVDWNRSFDSESSNYQAPIGMAEASSCNVFSQQSEDLVGQNHTARGAQATTRGGDYLYVFTVEDGTTNEKIVYRRAQLGPSKSQPCTGPISQCLSFFSGVDLVPAVDTAAVSAYSWDNFLFVAYPSETDGTLRVRWYSIGVNGVLSLVGQHSFQEFPAAAAEFVVRYDGTQSPELRLLWSLEWGTSGIYVGATWEDSTDTWSTTDFLTTCDSQMLTGPNTPAALAWPDPHNPYAAYSYRRTCSFFPDDSDAARFYCYDPVGQCWEDETPFRFPISTTPGACPGLHVDVTYNILGVDVDFCVPEAVAPLDLVFTPRRYSWGSQASPYTGAGNLQLLYYSNGSSLCDHYVPAVWISEEVSQSNPIETSLLWGGQNSPHWREYFGNKWTCLQEGANLSIYVDETMGSAMASAAVYSNGKARLRYYPFADGSPDMEYMPLSDFVVMEQNLCTAVRSAAASGFCY